MDRPHPYNAVCNIASDENWCWKIGCTTCGCMHFRYAFYELMIGRHPDDADWQTRSEKRGLGKSVGDLFDISKQVGQSAELLQILASADLVGIARSCKYPDYLGYFGLAADFLSDAERRTRTLTSSWVPQLAKLVPPDSRSGVELSGLQAGDQRLLTASTLDRMEYEVLPEYQLLPERTR
jgi:hypothetical protein